MKIINKKQSHGFSLIELIVAMAVGTLIVGGAFGLHSGTRKTQKVNEAQMDMVADARFAVEMISYDLRHAGVWGSINKSGLVDCKSSDTACASSASGDTPPTTATKDCAAIGAPEWAFDLALPVFATDSSNPYGSTCIQASEKYKAFTDVLEVRYADSNPTLKSNLRAGQAYIRSNTSNGRIFIGAVEPTLDIDNTDPLTKNHQLHAYAYYISSYSDAVGDGIPSLRRAALANGPAVQSQVLVSGVTDLQVQFGEDVNNDLVVDRYVNPGAVSDWSKVYAAKIWLVMQSDEQQVGVDTKKTFTIAGTPVDYGGKDGYRYFMVASVVNLRNLKQF